MYNPATGTQQAPDPSNKMKNPSHGLPSGVVPNWGLIGHEWAVQLLRQQIILGSQRHAYLFAGASGLGRRTLAIRLAQALNCLQPVAPAEPCLGCRTCTQLEAMLHPDLSVIQGERAGGMIKVDQIRELQRSLALSPYTSRYRVGLLLHFEYANPSAANALLKTLEEPPPQVILLLTAESPESLPATVVSRCEVLRLRPLGSDTLSRQLVQSYGLAADRATLVAHLSAGRPALALRMLQDTSLLANRASWLEEQQRLLVASRMERFAYADELSKDRVALREAILTWLSFWRDVLLRASGASGEFNNLDKAEEIELLAGRFDLEIIRGYVLALERTFDLLDRNANLRLATEVLLLDLPIPSVSTS